MTCYFAATVYNSEQVESTLCDEIAWTVKDVTPPTIDGSVEQWLSVATLPDLTTALTITDNVCSAGEMRGEISVYE